MLIVWVIGQWLKDPAKSGDTTQHGLLECCYKLKIFFFKILYTACNVSNSACGMRVQGIEQRTQVTQDQVCVIKEHIVKFPDVSCIKHALSRTKPAKFGLQF